MKFKRILIKAPWDITVDYDEIDEKTIPKKHMLVKILYSSISPGTEIACIGGQESWFPLPNIPGYSAVARVEALGEEVSKFKVGDIVFAQAHHREYEIINSEGFVIKIPDGIDLAEASFMKLAEISITSLRTSDIELGDYVAVSGLGIIGNFAAQFANNQGGTVIAIDYSQNRLNLIKEMGIKHTINSSCDDVNAKIKEITEGHGIDTFIDATGIMPAIVEYIKYVKKGGEMILLGTPRGEFVTDIHPLVDAVHNYLYNVTLKGAHECNTIVQENPRVKHTKISNARTIFRCIKDGRIKVKPLISKIIKPEEAPDVYVTLRDDKNKYIGIVIKWV